MSPAIFRTWIWPPQTATPHPYVHWKVPVARPVRVDGFWGGGGERTAGLHSPGRLAPEAEAPVQRVLPGALPVVSAAGQLCIDGPGGSTGDIGRRMPHDARHSPVYSGIGSGKKGLRWGRGAHQLLGSANAETTPAGAPAAAADRTQRPDATCEGKNG